MHVLGGLVFKLPIRQPQGDTNRIYGQSTGSNSVQTSRGWNALKFTAIQWLLWKSMSSWGGSVPPKCPGSLVFRLTTRVEAEDSKAKLRQIPTTGKVSGRMSLPRQ